MYSLAAYGEMISDCVRADAYAAALRRAITPGATVADIGTGTGIMACLACVYGAGRVYAIEPSDIIEVARQIARDSGFADRIEFIQARSLDVSLPRRADVVVSDLRGVLPPFQAHLPSVIDARERLLAPGGVLIARRDVVRIAVAGAPALYERCVRPWRRRDHGLDMRAAARLALNSWHRCDASASDVLLEPRPLATLDYATLAESSMRGEASWTVPRAAEAHGLLLWFDADLGGDIAFSTAPGAAPTIYGQAFFPWLEPVTLGGDDTVSVSVRATMVGDDYVWTWSTRVVEAGSRRRIKAEFRQSSFFGVPLTSRRIAKRSIDYVPTLGEDGRIDRFILGLLDDGVPLGRIADEVRAKFHARVPTFEQALARVAELSLRYSES